MTPKLRWGACSEIGLVRQINEDSKYHEPPLFAVADGMGGHSAGDVASALAIEELARELKRSDSIGDAVHAANRAIFEKASKDPSLLGMGTTITALVADDTSAQIAHVGDSRAYLLRDGELSRLTTDHTVVSRLVQQGRILPEDADRHPQRSYLERALGVDAEVEVDVHVMDFAPGDRVLLCSDGLFGMIDDHLILKVLLEERDPQRAAERLCEEAVHAGGSDNVTCIVIDFPSEEPKTVDSTNPHHAAFAQSRVDTGPLSGPQSTSSPRPPAARFPMGAAPAPPPEPADDRPSGRLKALTAIAVGVIVLVALGMVARSAIKDSWYVGSDEGKVAIFNGVPGQLAGVKFSKVVKTTELSLADLPEDRAGDLEDGIDAKSQEDAEKVIRDLQGSVLPSPAPSPSAPAGAPPAPDQAGPAPAATQAA